MKLKTIRKSLSYIRLNQTKNFLRIILRIHQFIILCFYYLFIRPFYVLINNEAKKKLKHAFLRNTLLAKFTGFSFLYNFLNFNKNLTIIIYQMGKVGSYSLNASLRSLGLSSHHIHRLNSNKLDFFIKKKHDLLTSYFNLIKSKYRKTIPSDELKIISLVREPVARTISAFFFHMRGWYPRYRYKYNTFTIENLKEFFLENYSRHRLPLTWFDKEMKRVFNIDVYSEKFPKEKGYKIYKGAHPDLLVLKLEKLNDCISEAIKKFLNIDFFILKKENIAENKFYSKHYMDFISAKILPRRYVERMYNSKFAKYFYSEAELNKFKKKWIGIKS